jgi:hypothetical protein
VLAAAAGLVALRVHKGSVATVREPPPAVVSPGSGEGALPALASGASIEVVPAHSAVVLAAESAVLPPPAPPSAHTVIASPKVPPRASATAVSVPPSLPTSSLPSQLGDLKLH